MPLVINEIRIVTEVGKQEQPAAAGAARPTAPRGEDRAKLVAEVTEQVLRTLQEQRER